MMRKLKLTILVENTVGVPLGLVSEWGLSMFLDFGDERILFDTGEQGNLVSNAQILGCDLRHVDKVILSHGHYDHTGGLLRFLQYRGKVPVYAHPDLFTAHYGRDFKGKGDKYLGVPFRSELLESTGAEFHWHREPVEISPGLWLSGEITRSSSFERIEDRMLRFEKGQAVPDMILDDLSLFYISDQGLIILLGCGHSGLVNIIEYAKKVTGEGRIRAIIGGTHLGPASLDQQNYTIEYLKGLPDLACLAPNHCTGLSIMSKLASEFSSVFTWAAAGRTLEF